MKVNDMLWIEKYRPKSIDEIVMSDMLKKRFSEILNNPITMPHLLFIGVPGSGKTSLARILIDNIIKDDSDLLILNGSDKRGIDVFRTLIPDFLSVPPISSIIKIIMLDEGDNMTSDAKQIFRSLLEKYHTHGRFIITANEDTFTPAIKSRFEITKFSKLDKDYIMNFCKRILHNENIDYDFNIVKQIVDLFYPDVRKIVGTIQQNSIDGKLIDSNITMTNEDRLIEMVLDLIKNEVENKTFDSNVVLFNISKFINTNYVDYIQIYKILFSKLSYKCIPLKVIISKFLNNSVNAISPSMIFYEFVVEVKNTSSKLRGIVNSDEIVEK